MYGVDIHDKNNTTYTLKSLGNGIYESKEISFKSSDILTVKNPTSNSGLIPASDAGKVTNITTLNEFKIGSTTSFGIIKEYSKIPSGNYIFIEITGGKVFTTYTFGSYSYLIDIAYLGYASTVGIIIGVLTIAAGALIDSPLWTRRHIN
ncbi:hypothetical protein [Acidiplasma cupricumulans]|jgi:hypothetical protein|nr:hypothetical protein [Acidiplasma cupricumulans]